MKIDRFAILIVNVDPSLGFSENMGYAVCDRKGATITDYELSDGDVVAGPFDTFDEAHDEFLEFEEQQSELWVCTCVDSHNDCGYWEIGHP